MEKGREGGEEGGLARGVTMTRDVNRADGVGFPYPARNQPASGEGEGRSRNITW